MAGHARCVVCLMSTSRDADAWIDRGDLCDACYKMLETAMAKSASRAADMTRSLKSLPPKGGARGPQAKG